MEGCRDIINSQTDTRNDNKITEGIWVSQKYTDTFVQPYGHNNHEKQQNILPMHLIFGLDKPHVNYPTLARFEWEDFGSSAHGYTLMYIGEFINKLRLKSMF